MLSPSSSVPAYFSPTQSWINLQFDNFLLKGNFFLFFFPQLILSNTQQVVDFLIPSDVLV